MRKYQHEVAAAERRAEATLEGFARALPADLRERVGAALEDPQCLLWPWLGNLYRGRCRLPEDLPEAVLRRLVEVLLDESEHCEPWPQPVCRHCGLQYVLPRRQPLQTTAPGSPAAAGASPRPPARTTFFAHAGCPGCGASTKAGDMTWAHLIGDDYWFRGQDSGGASADTDGRRRHEPA